MHAATAPDIDHEPLLRGNLFAAECPSREVLQHVTSRWGVLVLVALLGSGTLRFSELRRGIGGVSERMLAQTLQWLESDGFVLRVEHPVQPPHVDYRLTPLGREVGRHVRELFDWIEGKLPAILDARGRQGGPEDDQPSSRPKKRIVRS
ncbi:MAG TPA: helix-turn-helix domain-containing protein [Piscinibacter sp.]|jgi:DNA-binding HxlR family transcriptional regulator|uniref:winged helix-turn-helix transcriptional regulator n=1 Tax=Piscinibacter sp. TaxID=1903157 RepID=UPI001B707B8B|nr:helix-turn-helix domain-containing protein [Piscinibacter sp.]MBK7533609.1 helix-turn-helix transcriptional regulator [Piscinibacter sp.]MBP6541023.1 helix-turn-helix transcriptional regulator [Piscinibacter sp.]HPG80271.1 helix-turn-helix domain-containing protein [Piscinibacter sp.]HPM67480.1 helix-turn-helix domain-containing protein [Piscinibacter sp.]